MRRPRRRGRGPARPRPDGTDPGIPGRLPGLPAVLSHADLGLRGARRRAVPRMPAAVAHRLQSVVAQESARRQTAAAEPASSPRTPQRAVTLGHFGADRHRTPGWRRWVPVLVAATAAAVLGCGGYVISATAGLNEPPVVAAAITTDDLAAQAAGLEQSRDLDPHRFSNPWSAPDRSPAAGSRGWPPPASTARPHGWSTRTPPGPTWSPW